jgi:hypothetical protein
MTVAGPGEETFVVPGGAAISDQTWSLLPIGTAFLPVEMITESGSPHVGVRVGVGLDIPLGVGVTVAVGMPVGVSVTVGVLVAIAALVGLGVGVTLGGRVGVGVGVGVAVNVSGATRHGTILTDPFRVPLRSMPVAVPPPPLKGLLCTSTCRVCSPVSGVKPRIVSGVMNPILLVGIVVRAVGLPSRETVAVLSARICRSGDEASGPHCSQQSSYEYCPAGQSSVVV